MRTVAVLVVDGTLGFELAVPGQVFGSANLMSGEPLYDVRICSAGRSGSVATAAEFGGTTIHPAAEQGFLETADLVVVPGDELTGTRSTAPPSPEVLAALRAAAARGARLASLCVGAFTLAAAGLLDGRRATTHWAYADELARRHPAVHVDPKALYIDTGQILTSAGVTSSIDLCIYIVRSDHGDRVASATARHLVMPPHRLGGQAQFVQRDTLLGGDGDLGATLRWLEAHIDRPITLADIARHAGLSPRSTTRHFQDQTGAPPLKWLLNARIERAKEMLSTTDRTVEQVARESGFATGTTFRHHFTRIAGVSPSLYRRTFRPPGR
jgi:transcriptional regulator GlxA family with amidase domain